MKTLDTVLANGAPFPHANEIPDSLREWILPVLWDRERLWQLILPRRTLPIALLRWHYTLPFWRDRDRLFQVTPQMVMTYPQCYPDQYNRIQSADTGYPIHIVRRHNRWLILDGLHRLAKLELSGSQEISAHVLKPSHVARILIYA